MFPEIEIGSRPSGLFLVLLLRVGVQGVLGSTKTKMAGQRNSGAAWQRGSVAAWQRGNGVKEQRSSGVTEQLSSSKMVVSDSTHVARMWLAGKLLNVISELASTVHFATAYPWPLGADLNDLSII